MSGRAKRNQSPSRPNTLRLEPLEDRDLLSAISPLPGKPSTVYAGDYAGIDQRTPSHPVQQTAGRDGQGHSDTTPDSKEYVTGYPASDSNRESQQEYRQSHADKPNDTVLATIGRAQAGSFEPNREVIGQPARQRQTGLNDQSVMGGPEGPLPRSAGPAFSAAEAATPTVSQVSGSHLRGQPWADLLLLGISVRDLASLDDALAVVQDQADTGCFGAQERLVSVPLTNSLIVGTVPVDLAAIERGVDQFFARVESLGEELISSQAATKLAHWLLGAGLTAAAWQLAQWRLTKRPLQPNLPATDWRNRRLAWLLGFAVLPPGDMP